ncbi:hypothetical protein [Pseudobacteriovorax antillogorgiicola]|uniref:3-oxoacyl-[acyl-carrier-protein] synthase-3 n=1 Tax=Pseudobacteriovorax antillogorgiicola TaxID=1513793 RepID=A0A1Y6C1U0_9BACT|nr:hypothetical protein [Pseudobacteriovorax antillogorgiicola]TCS51201.1 3-oxoacyl-[acyl-carrier-protein] synthase-3 [Pseudobacteriovorax antillogorgiicola]SMF37438.1 3-oxoacyl-[acyl-carrier-protein] synthase-3 [Pseudobacteriovorax antillogorgiicola]
MGIGIIDIEYQLGSTLCSTDDYCKDHGIDQDLSSRLHRNASQHYYRSHPKEIFELGVKCVDDILRNNGKKPKDVSYIVYCHTSQANVLPPPFSIVDIIRQSCHLTNSVGFSVSQQNCVSPIHALSILNQLMEREEEDKVAVLVTIDTILLEHLRRISDSGMQSDGASAILIGPSFIAGNEITGISTFNDKKTLHGILDDGSYEESPNYLWNCTSLMRKSMRASGISASSIETVCPQNTHKPSWPIVLNALKIPLARLHDNGLNNIGHVLGSDIAINIKDSGAYKKPGHHLIFSSGIGGCFGSFVLKTNRINRAERA